MKRVTICNSQAIATEAIAFGILFSHWWLKPKYSFRGLGFQFRFVIRTSCWFKVLYLGLFCAIYLLFYTSTKAQWWNSSGVTGPVYGLDWNHPPVLHAVPMALFWGVLCTWHTSWTQGCTHNRGFRAWATRKTLSPSPAQSGSVCWLQAQSGSGCRLPLGISICAVKATW